MRRLPHPDKSRFAMTPGEDSPSPGGRELEGGEFHPHPSQGEGQALSPLPSRERSAFGFLPALKPDESGNYGYLDGVVIPLYWLLATDCCLPSEERECIWISTGTKAR
jgi:hypothetical protein